MAFYTKQSVSGSLPSASRPNDLPRQSIALISLQADPAVERVGDNAIGQSVYVRQVGEALAKLGWQVDIFTRKLRPEDTTIVQQSPYCRIVRLGLDTDQSWSAEAVLNALPQLVNTFQNFQTKQGANYPLIHSNDWLSAAMGLRLQAENNIQLVHTYHTLGAEKYREAIRRPSYAEARVLIEQQILHQANRVVAISPQQQDLLRSLISESGRIEVIPCGTDIESFYQIPQADARRELGFNLEDPIILHVGRFAPYKGIETLVKAFAELVQDQRDRTYGQNLRLVLVGGSEAEEIDEQEKERIEQLVQTLGLAAQTTFVGRVNYGLMPLYYTAADVCVIPSHYEPFGLVAIEAMACGVPVVASDVGGLRFTVTPDETGLLVPPRDVAAFAAAIDRILTDEVWTKKLKRQASARVQENFSWAGVGAQLGDLYRRLLAESLMGNSVSPSVSIADLQRVKVS